MNKFLIIIIVVLLLMAGFGFISWKYNLWPFGGAVLLSGEPQNSTPQNLAQCLTAKGVKMYGAYWCSHCKTQKELFGDTWGDVKYVECSLPSGPGQKAECTKAGITGYPTWVFPDGPRLEGEQTLENLAEAAGCSL